MNVDIDIYARNFRIFYSKIIGGHPDQLALQKKFKLLLQNEADKWRKGLFTNAEDSVSSVKQFLSKTRSLQPKKTQNNKKCFQWLMQTTDFSRAFLFGCLFSLLQLKSKQGIQLIRQHLQSDDVFVQEKVFKGAALRKITYSWSKIEKLFQNSLNAKPHTVIADCLNDFCQQFIDILYQVFAEGRISKLDVTQMNEGNLKKLTNILKINIIYFQLQKSEIKSTIKTGQYKKNIHIGYLIQEKTFVVSKQLPKKHKQEVQKQKTLIKLSKISQDLFKMYDNSDIKLKSLESVLSVKHKTMNPCGLKAPPKMSNKLLRKVSLSMSSSRF